jgi:Flp pilus assembly protein TadG
MKRVLRSFVARLVEDQRGQILPWMALLTVLFLAMAGLTLDLGRGYVCYRELQASTDAAALAGARAMSQASATVASAKSVACSYSSNTTASATCPVGINVTPNMPNVTIDPELKCVSSSIVVAGCVALLPTGYNVIQVTQTAVIPTIFIEALQSFGIQAAHSLTLNTTSTAAIQSGVSPGVNIAVIIDTTRSMQDSDTSCGAGEEQINCALKGLRQLLGELYPCTTGSSASTCNGPYDQVALFTFPNITANTAQYDTSCAGKNPSIPPYSYVPVPTKTNTSWSGAPSTGTSSTASTYEVTTGYDDNFSATNSAQGGLNTSSALGIAAGAGSCSGLQAPGGDGTYLAGAMYAAITSLQAAATSTSTSAIILLTDGASNSTDFDNNFKTVAQNPPTTNKAATVAYPSTVNQCQQTVDAGNYATSLGITVYTVAYGASTDASQCSTDTSIDPKTKRAVANVISPCTEIANTASSSATFFSDSQSSGGCVAPATPAEGLVGIFGDIGTTFLKARLVPNSVTSGS